MTISNGGAAVCFRPAGDISVFLEHSAALPVKEERSEIFKHGLFLLFTAIRMRNPDQGADREAAE